MPADQLIAGRKGPGRQHEAAERNLHPEPFKIRDAHGIGLHHAADTTIGNRKEGRSTLNLSPAFLSVNLSVRETLAMADFSGKAAIRGRTASGVWRAAHSAQEEQQLGKIAAEQRREPRAVAVPFDGPRGTSYKTASSRCAARFSIRPLCGVPLRPIGTMHC